MEIVSSIPASMNRLEVPEILTIKQFLKTSGSKAVYYRV